jgi:hypothetical protein
MECYGEKPEQFCVYMTADEPCWYIVVPWDDGLVAFRSSRVIVVGKRTGKIHFDGAAGD